MCLYMNVPHWINIERFGTAITASATQLFEVSLVLFLLNCKSSRHRQRHSGTQECRKSQDKAIMPSTTSSSTIITDAKGNTDTSNFATTTMFSVVPTISAGLETTKTTSTTSNVITAMQCAITEPRSSSLVSCVALDVDDVNRPFVTTEDS